MCFSESLFCSQCSLIKKLAKYSHQFDFILQGFSKSLFSCHIVLAAQTYGRQCTSVCVLRICASANSNNSIPIHFCYTTTNFYAKPQRICVYGVRVSCFLGKPIEKMLQGEVAYTSQDLLKKVYRKKPILHPFNNCRHFRAL